MKLCNCQCKTFFFAVLIGRLEVLGNLLPRAMMCSPCWAKICVIRSIYLSLLLCVLYLTGCGQRLPDRPSGLPDTIPCTLTITFGGEKIEDVSVLFTPKDKSQPWYAGGKTDSEGKVRLKTGGHYDGVIPGKYTVSFQKTGQIELDKNDMPIRSYSLIPFKYTAGQSKEMITVTAKQSVYVLELDGLP